jgi:inosine-uridine nucleoside N-ribohydrolase
VIADLMQFYLDGQKRVFGLDIAPMHDVCAVFPFVRPDLLTFVDAAVEVELAGRLTRGMTVCDLRNKRAGGTGAIQEARRPNARVAVASDARPLIAEVIDVVLACP